MSNKTNMRRLSLLAALLMALGVAVPAQQPPPTPLGGTPSKQPPRDTSAQQNKDVPPTPTGRITGRVLASDNGRPVKRARVFVNAVELPGGRGVLTDDQGVFDLAELPAGRYT